MYHPDVSSGVSHVGLWEKFARGGLINKRRFVSKVKLKVIVDVLYILI